MEVHIEPMICIYSKFEPRPAKTIQKLVVVLTVMMLTNHDSFSTEIPV